MRFNCQVYSTASSHLRDHDLFFVCLSLFLVLCVQTHMFLQVVQAIATAFAEVAFVRHQIGMHYYMTVQVADLFEALAANCTDIRTLIHVSRRDVRLQISLSYERGLTFVAFERPDVRMYRQVRLEHVLMLEVFLAEVTLERPLIVVYLLVH